jgi:GNAT superfamily N-acetyltransferase
MYCVGREIQIMEQRAKLIEAIDKNRMAYMADFGRSPKVELHNTPEISWFTTGLPFPRLNRIFHTRFPSNHVEVQIQTALSHFKTRHIPLVWHIGPLTHPRNLGSYLTAHSLRHVGDEVGMAVDLLSLPDQTPTPATLQIEQIRDKANLKQWSYIFTRTFDIPEEAADTFACIEASLPFNPTGPRRYYIGYLNEQPVACALLFLGAGVAGLYNIGTVPEVRRQGIGTAITLTPLLAARALGYRIGTLHASLRGQGIYRQLGFKEYCSLGRYILELRYQ